ncbi:MAG: hypothetical protein ACLFVT_07470 [Syntrophobacteria bacterium]
MKTTSIFLGFVLALALSFGCASNEGYHKTELPGPESYLAHFSDMDESDDGLVTWNEFEDYFPHAELRVFKALDLNEDQYVDHEEWHKFMQAHGSRHKTGHGPSY